MLRVATAGVNPRSLPSYVAFEQRMAQLGYREGQNFIFDFRHTQSTDAYEAAYRA
jgi:hypothetical protein